jgi:hypothetical protein
MLDPIAALCGGRLPKLTAGKPDGPRVALVALDALTRPPPTIAEAPT